MDYSKMHDLAMDIQEAIKDYGDLDVRADGSKALDRVAKLAGKLQRMAKRMKEDSEA